MQCQFRFMPFRSFRREPSRMGLRCKQGYTCARRIQGVVDTMSHCIAEQPVSCSARDVCVRLNLNAGVVPCAGKTANPVWGVRAGMTQMQGTSAWAAGRRAWGPTPMWLRYLARPSDPSLGASTNGSSGWTLPHASPGPPCLTTSRSAHAAQALLVRTSKTTCLGVL